MRAVRGVTVALPSVLSAAALAGLSHFGWVGRLPLLPLLALLATVTVIGEATGLVLKPASSRRAVRLALGAQMAGVTTMIYAIGWGPTLTIGYLYGLSRALDEVGSWVWRPVLAWTALGMTFGQLAIATGLTPSYIREPYVHGLAVLAFLAAAFVMQLLGAKTAENERAHRDLEQANDDLEGQVSERLHVDADLRSALSLINATLESTADGILVVDRAGVITKFNAPFATMWRLPDALLAGRDDRGAIEFVVDQLSCPADFLAKVDELYATPEAESSDTLTFKDGRVFERHSRPQRVDGEVVGRVWSFRDVTDRVRLEGELAHRAFHDPLTGLANKALFHDRLRQALDRAARSGRASAVLFLDVDNFKTVNDSLGHAAGDELLVAVAERLRGCARRSDTVARLGGDEFAILTEDLSDRIPAHQLADRVLAALNDAFDVHGTEVSPTVSVGIAFAEPGATAEVVLRDADLAMYCAKERGKNRYVEFEPQMHTATAARLAVEGELRHALADGQLAVFFQPIVEVATRRIIGFEALVRWHHPTRGLVPPDQFIPIAETTGLIEAIDRHVLRLACDQAATWPRPPGRPGYSLSVNVSARRLVDPLLIDDVATATARLHGTATGLTLEITESAVLRSTAAVTGQLRAARALGAQVALDDFGTGYSSLAHLRQLPVDSLKIDRSFVADLTARPARGGIAQAILQLAVSLNLTAVAEGVENAEQLVELQRLGCHHAQGYHLGRPLDAAGTLALLLAQPGPGRPATPPGAAPVLLERR